MHRVILIIVGMTALLAGDARAAEPDVPSVSLAPDQQRLVLEEALQLYDEGIALRPRNMAAAISKFDESADRFHLLIDAGVHNGQLYYNLANAQLQAGEIGRAVLSYRRALRYMPGNPLIESNLDYARSQVRSQIPVTGSRALISTVIEAVGVVPWSWRVIGALTLYVLIWVFASARMKWGRVVPRSLPWWCALGAAIFGVTVAAPQLIHSAAREGVIISDDVTVRMGNGEGFEAQFAEPIHEGVEFTVVEKRGEWLEIELPNGGRGWVRADQVELI